MNSAATASTCPQSAESYHVTGMNSNSAAASTPRRSPNQRRPARYSRTAIAMSAATAGTFRSTTSTEAGVVPAMPATAWEVSPTSHSTSMYPGG